MRRARDGLTIPALSRERRESHVATSHNRCAALSVCSALLGSIAVETDTALINFEQSGMLIERRPRNFWNIPQAKNDFATFDISVTARCDVIGMF